MGIGGEPIIACKMEVKNVPVENADAAVQSRLVRHERRDLAGKRRHVVLQLGDLGLLPLPEPVRVRAKVRKSALVLTLRTDRHLGQSLRHGLQLTFAVHSCSFPEAPPSAWPPWTCCCPPPSVAAGPRRAARRCRSPPWCPFLVPCWQNGRYPHCRRCAWTARRRAAAVAYGMRSAPFQPV